LGRRHAGRAVEITFEPEAVSFLCRLQGSDSTISATAQGLTKADIMGELADFVRLPVYQLALPLSAVDCRKQSYAASVLGTTS
jgi:hypothetical protein